MPKRHQKPGMGEKTVYEKRIGKDDI